MYAMYDVICNPIYVWKDATLPESGRGVVVMHYP